MPKNFTGKATFPSDDSLLCTEGCRAVFINIVFNRMCLDVVTVTTTSAMMVSGSPQSGRCRSGCDSRSVTVRTTGPVQACVSDTALPHIIHRDVGGRQRPYQCQPVSARRHVSVTSATHPMHSSSAYSPATCTYQLVLSVDWLTVVFLLQINQIKLKTLTCIKKLTRELANLVSHVSPVTEIRNKIDWTSVEKELENGRYGHAPIRSDTSIRVYVTADTDTNTSTPCVGVPVTYIIISGRSGECSYFSNGWHTPSKAKHADH